MEKSRRKLAREKATIGIYQYLLVDHSIDEIIDYLKKEKDIKKNEDTLQFATWLVETTIANKDSYIEVLSKYLKDGWQFERLGVIEQAIMLIATCELLESDLPKKIVINEAVVNAKTFCADDSYKFINGVLSQL